MNLTELKKKMAETTGQSQEEADKSIKAVLGIISEALEKGDSVALPGFGSFSINERAARTCRNPRTGESMQLSASKAVKFKAGKALKDAVNQ